MFCGCWHSLLLCACSTRCGTNAWSVACTVQHTPLPKNYLCSLEIRYFVRWHYFRCYELFTSIVSERKWRKNSERGKGKTKRNFCHRIACKTRVEHNLSKTYIYIYMVWAFLCVSNLQRSKPNCRLMSPSDEGPSFGIWALVRLPSITFLFLCVQWSLIGTTLNAICRVARHRNSVINFMHAIRNDNNWRAGAMRRRQRWDTRNGYT